MDEEKTEALSLYEHVPHKHKSRNANDIHKAEHAASGINQKIAIGLTKAVGTMPTAYIFALLACIGLLAILGILPPLTALLVAWLSQTFLQLVFLPILSVGQNVLGRKQEIQADEMFATTQRTLNDSEQLIAHLDKQDTELLKQTQILIELHEKTLAMFKMQQRKRTV